MDSGNTKRYEEQAALASEDWVERSQAEGGAPVRSNDTTADPLSTDEPLYDAPEDYAWTDGVHTIYRSEGRMDVGDRAMYHDGTREREVTIIGSRMRGRVRWYRISFNTTHRSPLWTTQRYLSGTRARARGDQ